MFSIKFCCFFYRVRETRGYKKNPHGYEYGHEIIPATGMGFLTGTILSWRVRVCVSDTRQVCTRCHPYVQVVFWRMLCRPSSVADALPLLFSGGSFAAVVELVVDRFGWMFCHLGWFVGGCFATFEFGDCLLSRRWCIFSRLRSLVVPGFAGSCEFPSSVLLTALVLCWGRLPLAWWCVVIALIASAY